MSGFRKSGHKWSIILTKILKETYIVTLAISTIPLQFDQHNTHVCISGKVTLNFIHLAFDLLHCK